MRRCFKPLFNSIPALGMLVLAGLPSPAFGGGNVVAWGATRFGLSTPCVGNVVAIATGYEHSILLREDGTVADCGMFYDPLGGGDTWDYPITVPAGLNNVVAVAGGNAHSLALKSDGTVVAWGRNTHGQTDVPPGLANVVAISASAWHNLALKADGTVIGWGGVPASVPTGLSNVIAIAAGSGDLALKADGSVVSWGFPYASLTNNLAGLSNVVAISAGWMEWLALKADGTVAGESWNYVPTNLSNIVAISASSGNDHHISLAIKSDGTVVGWGFDFYGYGTSKPMVPAGLSNGVAVSSDSSHCLALVGGGRPFLANRLVSRTAVMSGKTFFRIEATGAWPLSYQWKHDGTDLPGATKAILALSNLQSSQSGAYSVSVSNPYGAITSGEVSLALAPLLITKPLDQLTFVGGTASFSVVAQGSGPFGYQWKMDGTDIEGATNSLLTLTNVQFGDAGSYSVAVTNAFGVATSEEAFLSVVPSLITTEPKDQVAFVGGPAFFQVVAESSAPPSYQWSVNGIAMNGATNATLALTGLQPAQAGAYSVIVSNVFGTVTSKDARLSIVRVATWGSVSQSSVPADLTNVVAIAGNLMALKADGTVASWPGWPEVPTGLTNVEAIAGGNSFGLALKTGGAVVGWGSTNLGEINIPPDVTNAVAIAAHYYHGLALSTAGTVTAWGYNYAGAATVPAGLAGVVAIAAGAYHDLALRDDGTILAWGDNRNGQTNVPSDCTNIVAIASGSWHNLALRADGRVVSWGYNAYGQCDVPVGLSNVVAVACGHFHSMALTSDGNAVAWGLGTQDKGSLPEVGQAIVPQSLTNVVAIAGGNYSSLALIGDGSPVLHVPMSNPTTSSNGFSISFPTQSGRVYRLEYKESLSDANWKELPLVAGNGHVRELTDRTATSGQRFYRVRRW